jgi:hypothetical protein
MFFHPVGCTGPVMHSSMSGCEISMHYFSCSGGSCRVSINSATRHFTPNLCFCNRWECISVGPGTKCRCTIFYAQVGPVRMSQKTRRDTIHRTCVFASGVICGSRSTFRCVRATKCRHTTFYARVGLVRIPQILRRDTLR